MSPIPVQIKTPPNKLHRDLSMQRGGKTQAGAKRRVSSVAFPRGVYRKPLINSQRIPLGREKRSGKRHYWELMHKQSNNSGKEEQREPRSLPRVPGLNRSCQHRPVPAARCPPLLRPPRLWVGLGVWGSVLVSVRGGGVSCPRPDEEENWGSALPLPCPALCFGCVGTLHHPPRSRTPSFVARTLTPLPGPVSHPSRPRSPGDARAGGSRAGQLRTDRPAPFKQPAEAVPCPGLLLPPPPPPAHHHHHHPLSSRSPVAAAAGCEPGNRGGDTHTGRMGVGPHRPPRGWERGRTGAGPPSPGLGTGLGPA